MGEPRSPHGSTWSDPTVEVDEDDDLADSTYGSGNSTASTLIKASAIKYEWKHGRRYHSYHSGSYNFPNDELEQERLDMLHHVFFRLLNDHLFLAPIDPDGMRILDIGTGTGIWPIQFGDLYPGAASIVGNDLSAIQPQWVPPNVRFIIDDVEADWDEVEPFDYIHCRYMAGSIRDWPRLVQQIFDHLKPGGWVEFQESDNNMFSEDESLTPDNKILEMMNGLMEACEKIGRDLNPAPSMKSWAQAAGFSKLNEQRFKLPLGTWPKDPRLKEVGALMGLNFLEGVDGWTSVLFNDVLGWSEKQVATLNADVRAAVRQKNCHLMFDFLVITGQKPST